MRSQPLLSFENGRVTSLWTLTNGLTDPPYFTLAQYTFWATPVITVAYDHSQDLSIRCFVVIKDVVYMGWCFLISCTLRRLSTCVSSQRSTGEINQRNPGKDSARQPHVSRVEKAPEEPLKHAGNPVLAKESPAEAELFSAAMPTLHMSTTKKFAGFIWHTNPQCTPILNSAVPLGDVGNWGSFQPSNAGATTALPQESASTVGDLCAALIIRPL